MKPSPGIVVTGADERTSLDDLLRLVELDPAVTIGVLLTTTPEGRNRYPSVGWVMRTVKVLRRRCAVHICGNAARGFLHNPARWLLLAGDIQVNGRVIGEQLAAYLEYLPSIITQHHEGNAHLVDAEVPLGHSLLVDASGGRGLSPERWERPKTSKPVGFAGGLGPDNLATELPRIAAVAGTGYWWVDMEGQLRDADDWFSADRAEAAIEAFVEWRERAER